MARVLASLAIVASISLTGNFAVAQSIPPSTQVGSDRITLNRGDHICIIGNTLGERLQHFGWLETLLHARFPQHELVIRNLSFSADELNPSRRLRSMSFGSPDEWLSGQAPIPQPEKLTPGAPVRKNRLELANTKADVIFAFFGYNESFAGSEGLIAFKKELESFIRHAQSQKYNSTLR